MAHTTNGALTCRAEPSVYTASRNEWPRPQWGPSGSRLADNGPGGSRIAVWAGFFTFMTFPCFPVLFRNQIALSSLEGWRGFLFFEKYKVRSLERGSRWVGPRTPARPGRSRGSLAPASSVGSRALQTAIFVFTFKISLWVSPPSEDRQDHPEILNTSPPALGGQPCM